MHLRKNNQLKSINTLRKFINRKSKRIFILPIFYLFSLLLFLQLFGCAIKPWEAPLEGETFDDSLKFIIALAKEQETCDQSFDGDLSLFYTAPFDKEAISGYLRFSLPSSYKFIVTNPFGQPMFMVAGNNSSFQIINTNDKKYVSGSLRSFFIRNHIPLAFLSGNWGEWLTGRNTMAGAEITAIRQDKEARGLWVTVEYTEGKKTTTSHLLLDTENKIYLERLLEDKKGDVVARITYGNKRADIQCQQPLAITLSGLDYGVTIDLKLSDIHFANEQKKYSLPIPKGYIRQFMP